MLHGAAAGSDSWEEATMSGVAELRSAVMVALSGGKYAIRAAIFLYDNAPPGR